MDDANDAETLAHDALASIRTRAGEIRTSKEQATQLQNNHAEMKYSIDATQKVFCEPVDIQS